jgi:signal transduction histidine kinase
MAFSKKEPGPGGRWIFRPAFFLVIWGLLALLLVINGIYEAQRLKDNLQSMLFDEGMAVISGLEKSAQSIFASWAAMEAYPEVSALLFPSPSNLLAVDDSVVDQVLEIASQIDQELGALPPREGQLARIAQSWHFSILEWITPHETQIYKSPKTAGSIADSFYRPLLEGKASYAIGRSEKKETGQMESLSLAIVRKAGKGILALQVDGPEIRLLRRMVVLEGLIEEWKGRGEVSYITLQGEDLEVWADTSPRKIGKKEENPFLQTLLMQNSRQPKGQMRKEKKILEVAKLVALDPKTKAIIRVGLSTDRIDQIMGADRRNITLFSLMLLAFGGLGIIVVSRMENRHLARVREMEGKVRQSEKLSSLANLAAGVAHEIRNPLNAIGMAIQRLQREFAPAQPEAQQEYLRFTEVLRGEVKRLNEIIEQFLFFARPARLDLQPVPVEEILESLLMLSQEAAEQKKIYLVKRIDSDLPLLQLDRQRVHEALWNLVTNALQSMPRGGRLELGAWANKEKTQVTIQIQDTGEGIPAENLGKIFDYYFSTKEKGMGLGLPLAHKIIREHGGTIGVESTVGKGTLFRIALPVPGEEG